MTKRRTEYVCQQCASRFPTWMGRCSSCGEWNTLVETVTKNPKKLPSLIAPSSAPASLSDIRNIYYDRLITRNNEFDRVLGGGIVEGSAVLIAGEPGIGKSTLLLEVASRLASSQPSADSLRKEKKKVTLNPASPAFDLLEPEGSAEPERPELRPERAGRPKQITDNSVLYVSGEESPQQIKIRAERTIKEAKNILVLSETDVDQILAHIESILPKLVIIDSIQTMQTQDLEAAAGTVGQVRESAQRLIRLSKSLGVPILMVGHITKEGAIAGPKVLEHLVDAVLFFEGDPFHAYRILRCTKNRFGSTAEVGVFEMEDQGLSEVKNPSAAFLGDRRDKVGSIALSILAGERPLIAEVQALSTPTSLPNPRRVSSGTDFSRLQLMIAILQKVAKLPLGSLDVFVSVAGGLDVSEPASDLAVCLSIASSVKERPISHDVVSFGEVGLLGEVRQVRGSQKRIAEAKRLGFKKFVTPERFSNLESALRILG